MRRGIVIGTAVAAVVAFTSGAVALSRSGESQSEAAFEAAGIESDAQGGDGRPVGLDPGGAREVSPPGQLKGKKGQFDGSVRSLDGKKPRDRGPRSEQGQPDPGISSQAKGLGGQVSSPSASAPSPSAVFEGLNRSSDGAGWPPDTNGDVGPNHFIQSVNTSIGIYSKSGAKISAFSFDALFGANGGTGTLCDTDNYGDPVVLYDTFRDRWVISDFAFQTDSGGNVTSDNYQCFAVSKSADPVNGGWWLYAFKVASGGDIADYPKLGVWPDGIYMSANVFGPSAFKNVRVWAFNKDDFYSGSASPRAVSFDLPQSSGGTTVFSLLPSNARSQTGMPPAGRPNLFTSIWGSYQLRVWKFAPNWTTPAASTFSGPTNASVATFSVGPSDVPSPRNSLDTLTYRLMMQNQYTNIGGAESLWLTHTVGSSNVARVRWYQLRVDGGTVASSPAQQSTWGSDSTHRFMPSLAVDKLGDMAVGYSVSSSSLNPGIRYAGRLVGDPASTLGQGETTLADGGGSQTYTNRWGDYATMTLDPDGCRFWFTSEIYNTDGNDWHTRIGSFAYPSCTGSGGGATAPADPTGLTAAGVSSTSVGLGWTDNADNETAYTVERSTNGTSFTSLTSTLAANSSAYTDSSASPSTSYWYRVRATNSVGPSGYSNVATATTPGTVPAAPTGLTAAGVSSTSVGLGWTDNADNETAYTVERSTNGTSFTSLTSTLAANSSAYTDSSASPSTSYWYRVRATNSVGPSGYSNVATATTPGTVPAAPTGLTAAGVSSTSVGLGWTDNADNETAYTVERSTNGTSFTSLTSTLAANSSAYTDSSASPSTSYWYRVRATNSVGPSGYSNVATATTPGTGGGDVIPPVLSLPGTLTVAATSTSGALVSYSVSATDNLDPQPVVSCAPPSGSLFAVGATTVSCTARDVSGNSSSGSFTVQVNALSPPPPSGGGGGGGGSGAADLYLTGSVEPVLVPVGGTLTWRLRVLDDKNYGPAPGVHVDVTLPAGVQVALTQADRGPGCVSSGAGTLRCDLDWLSSDAPYGNIVIVTNVTAAGELVLGATVGWARADANPSDNMLTLKANTPAPVVSAPSTPPVVVKARPKPVFGKPLTRHFGKPLKLRRVPFAGHRFRFTLPVKRSDTGAPLRVGKMAANPRVAGKLIKHAESFKKGKARLTFLVPRAARGKLIKIKIKITTSGKTTTRLYTYRVR